MRSWISWFSRSFSAVALATFRILPRNGRIAWVSRLRAALAEPPAESPSTRKISVPSAELFEQDVARFLVAGQPVLEIVADDGLDQLVGLDADQLFLGLALELRLLDEH